MSRFCSLILSGFNTERHFIVVTQLIMNSKLDTARLVVSLAFAVSVPVPDSFLQIAVICHSFLRSYYGWEKRKENFLCFIPFNPPCSTEAEKYCFAVLRFFFLSFTAVAIACYASVNTSLNVPCMLFKRG